MPYFRVDVDTYDQMLAELEAAGAPSEMLGERPSGEFEYHEASETFAVDDLGSVARLMREVLLAAGLPRLRVRYDGGFDEGFAYADGFLCGEETRSPAEALEPLAGPELTARISQATGANNTQGNAGELYGGAPPLQVAIYALEDLATDLATVLLGDGFGTGEYSLYGAFVADLNTGALVDEPGAKKPPEME